MPSSRRIRPRRPGRARSSARRRRWACSWSSCWVVAVVFLRPVDDQAPQAGARQLRCPRGEVRRPRREGLSRVGDGRADARRPGAEVDTVGRCDGPTTGGPGRVDTCRMANRLASATSPYLFQHADNPVDWWPWSDEAFAEASPARRAGADLGGVRGLPLVPRHGARVLRGRPASPRCSTSGFVRDQGGPRGAPRRRRRLHDRHPGDDRPGRLADDVFATPDGEPFFCGTYFPRPASGSSLDAIDAGVAGPARAGARRGRGRGRAGIADAAAAVAARRGRRRPVLDAAVDRAGATSYDEPRRVRRRAEVPAAHGAAVPAAPPPAHRRRRALEMVRQTGEAMARGGIYDQLAGGFARYSVDARWLVPHFEKMLYDNALLLRVYTHLWRLTGVRWPGGWRRDGRVPARRPDHRRGRLRVLVGRRHRRRRGRHLRVDAGPARRRAGRGGRRLGGRPARRDRRRHVRARRLRAAAARPTPTTRARWADVRPRRWPRAASGRSRPATTRWSRPGTGWPSPPWPRPAPLLDRAGRWATAAARGRRPAAGRPPGRRPAAARVPGRRVGEPAGVLEDYGAVAEAFCAVHQLTGSRRG